MRKQLKKLNETKANEIKEKIKKAIGHIEESINEIADVNDVLFAEDLHEVWDSLEFTIVYLNNEYIVSENEMKKNIKF